MVDTTNKIILYYRRIPLGALERTENGYMYSSDFENEQKVKNIGLLTYSEYSLWNSTKRESKKLFPEFLEIINKCSRADIVEMASITSQDSMWDKLVKLSRLEYFTPNFYVQQTEENE